MATKKSQALTRTDLIRLKSIHLAYKSFCTEKGVAKSLDAADRFAAFATKGDSERFNGKNERELILLLAGKLPFGFLSKLQRAGGYSAEQFEGADMNDSRVERSVLVIDGVMDGEFAKVANEDCIASISDYGPDEKYNLRRLNVDGKRVEAFVLTTWSNARAVKHLAESKKKSPG
jgi:hypothetical protein